MGQKDGEQGAGRSVVDLILAFLPFVLFPCFFTFHLHVERSRRRTPTPFEKRLDVGVWRSLFRLSPLFRTPKCRPRHARKICLERKTKRATHTHTPTHSHTHSHTHTTNYVHVSLYQQYTNVYLDLPVHVVMLRIVMTSAHDQSPLAVYNACTPALSPPNPAPLRPTPTLHNPQTHHHIPSIRPSPK